MFVIKFNDLSDALFYFNRLHEDAEKDYEKYSYIKGQYVLKTGENKYKEITKDLLRDYLKYHDMHNRDFRIISENLDYNLEEHGTIFDIKSASPWDHRWPGDYDEDAYLDVSEDDYCLNDIQVTGKYERDYFENHKNEFTWKLIKTKEL